MKYFFLLPLFLLFSSCGNSDKTISNENVRNSKSDALQSMKSISEYQLIWSKARTNIMLWVNTQGNRQEKTEMQKFMSTDFPKMKSSLSEMVKTGLFNSQDSIPALIEKMDALAGDYKDIMDELNNIQSYQDPMVMFPATSMSMGEGQQCELYYHYIDSHLSTLNEKVFLVIKNELDKVKD